MIKKTVGGLSDSEAVEATIATIIRNKSRHKSSCENETTFYYLKASLDLGYSEPLTAEQRAMNVMLTQIKASKSDCETAWKLYHELTSGRKIEEPLVTL